MENIKLFNEYAGICLAELYSSFPVKTYLSPEAMADILLPKEETRETDLFKAVSMEIEPGDPNTPVQYTRKHYEHSKFASETINWLVEAGYILAIKDEGGQEISGHVLSPKGLELLNAKPSVLNNESIGSRLVEASNNIAGETGKSLISEAVGLFLGAAFKATTGT